MKTVRTRIAPSPTGYPHIGTIYQALFNFAFAHRHNGKFLVRIEDTDRGRFVEGAEEIIFSSFDWFGVTEDESVRKDGGYGPYRQSERLDLYHKYVQELIEKGHAYYSYYKRDDAGKKKDYSQKETVEINQEQTVSEIEPTSVKQMIQMEDWVVKMKVPKDTPIKVFDQIRGEIVFESNQVTEQVLLKSDGFPTYHLAVVVDDHLMEITHVVRAEEWLSSFPKHKLLYDYFGWEMPPFFHTATLRNPDKSKLSKRHGHTNVTWYKENGYLPEAILNYLALLGWSHPEEKEIFSLDEFIQLFDLKDIRPVAPIFDLQKLTWMNQQYIQSMEDEKLIDRLTTFYSDKDLDKKLIKNLLPLLRTRMETLKDFESLTGFFFTAPEVKPRNEVEKEVAIDLYEALSTAPTWTEQDILLAFKTVLEKHSIRMPVLYYLLTGQEKGLPLPQSIETLGKEETLTRLKEIN